MLITGRFNNASVIYLLKIQRTLKTPQVKAQRLPFSVKATAMI